MELERLLTYLVITFLSIKFRIEIQSSYSLEFISVVRIENKMAKGHIDTDNL